MHTSGYILQKLWIPIVLLQQLAQRAGSSGTVLRKTDNARPKPRLRNRMRKKPGRTELAIVHKALHVRHVKIWVVRNCLYASKACSMYVRRSRYCCRLHIHRLRRVRRTEFGLLLSSCNRAKTYQRAAAALGFGSAAVSSIDDVTGNKRVSNPQRPIQSTRKTGRDNQLRGVNCNHRFGGASGCFGPYACAHEYQVISLKKFIPPTAILALHRSPPFDQRLDLAPQRSDNGNLCRHHVSCFIHNDGPETSR